MFGSGFFRPRHARSVEKGALKYIVLDLLKDKPSHGYEIIRAMEEKSHGLYSPSAGSIYPMLNLLEDMGYVIPSERDGKKIYTITDAGSKYLCDESAHIDDIKGRMNDFWGMRNNEDFRAVMHESRDIGALFRKHSRDLTPDQWRRIRESIHRTFCEVSDIIGRD
jgi:DNA-binding PadR family transcriptional regulator